jgi:putative spermidine/putrescine transport system permease protein
MPLHIYQQAVGANNWPFAAAISVVFTLAVMVVIYALNRVGQTSKAYAHG